MTVPELKSMVYLLPRVAWPIIKHAVANAGNHAVLWGDVSCAWLILRLLVTWGNMGGFRASLWVLLCLFSWVCRSDCQLQSWLSCNLSVYLFIGMLVKTKIPTTVGIYLWCETKQGRWELTTPVITHMVLAWLKINLHCIIQRCKIPTWFTRTLYPLQPITFTHISLHFSLKGVFFCVTASPRVTWNLSWTQPKPFTLQKAPNPKCV